MSDKAAQAWDNISKEDRTWAIQHLITEIKRTSYAQTRANESVKKEFCKTLNVKPATYMHAIEEVNSTLIDEERASSTNTVRERITSDDVDDVGRLSLRSATESILADIGRGKARASNSVSPTSLGTVRKLAAQNSLQSLPEIGDQETPVRGSVHSVPTGSGSSGRGSDTLRSQILSHGSAVIFAGEEYSSRPEIKSTITKRSFMTHTRRRTGTLAPNYVGPVKGSPRPSKQDLLSLIEQTHKSAEGILPKRDYDFIWDTISYNVEKQCMYLTLLLRQIKQYFTDGLNPRTSQNSQDRAVKTNPMLFVNSMSFVVLCFCHQLKEKKNQPGFKQLLNMIADFDRRYTEFEKISKESKDVAKATKRITQVLKYLISTEKDPAREKHQEKEYLRSLIRRAMLIDTPCLRNRGDVFIWSHILEHCCCDEYMLHNIVEIVLENTNSAAKSLKAQKRLGVEESVLMVPVLAGLHMLHTIFTYCRITKPELYDQAQHVLRPLYTWPKPCGPLAEVVLMMIQRERRASGFHLIQNYLDELHCPRFKLNEDENVQPLFYLADDANKRHQLWASMIGCTRAELATAEISFEMSDAAMAVFLLGALKYIGEVEIDDKIKMAMCEKKKSELWEHWVMLTDILTFISSGGWKDKNVLLSLKDQILEKDPQQITVPVSLPKPPVLKKRPSLQVTEEHEMKARDSLRMPMNKTGLLGSGHVEEDEKCSLISEDLTDPYTPQLPPIFHAAVPVNTQLDPIFPQKGAVASNIKLFPTNTTLTALSRVFEKFKDMRRDSATAIKIRVVLPGGIRGLHHLAMAYTSLLCEHKRPKEKESLDEQELVDAAQVEVFLVPFSDCRLARYIASKDLWYRRHVQQPFSSMDLVVPSVSQRVSLRLDSARSTHRLSHFYQNLVNNYTREARHSLKVNIWVCHAFQSHVQKAHTSTNTPDKLIPYIQGIEFGESVEKQAAMKSGNVTDKSPQNMVPPPSTVTLKWTKVNRSGVRTGVHAEPPAKYSRICSDHIPRENHHDTFRPSPNRSFFELYSELTPEERRSQRLARKRGELTDNQFLRRPYAHADSLEIVAKPGDQFHVKIDGQLYGPFIKIKLLPCRLDKSLSVTNDSPQIFMNIRTFMPVFGESS